MGQLEGFALTDDGVTALTVSKLYMMEADLEADPDAEDRVVKRDVVRNYADQVTAALGVDGAGSQELSWRDAREVAGGVAARPDPKLALATALEPLAPDARRYVLSSPALAKSVLAKITARRQALVVLVELAAFQAWPAGTEWEGDLHRMLTAELVGSFGAPVDVALYREVERELVDTTKRLARDEVDKKKLALLAVGGAAAGVVTGGLAAPVVGGVIGGAMGLSGAAATSAGLALLGGGSAAAGGLGVAGGTALLAGVAGSGSAGLAATTGWLRAARPTDVVAEAAKLEVLFEYALLREENTDDLRRLVVESIHRDIESVAERIDELTDMAVGVATENEELKQQLDDERAKRRVLEDTLAGMRDRTGQDTTQ